MLTPATTAPTVLDVEAPGFGRDRPPIEIGHGQIAGEQGTIRHRASADARRLQHTGQRMRQHAAPPS